MLLRVVLCIEESGSMAMGTMECTGESLLNLFT